MTTESAGVIWLRIKEYRQPPEAARHITVSRRTSGGVAQLTQGFQPVKVILLLIACLGCQEQAEGEEQERLCGIGTGEAVEEI